MSNECQHHVTAEQSSGRTSSAAPVSVSAGGGDLCTTGTTLWAHTWPPRHPATTAGPAAASQPCPRCRGGAHAGPVLGCSEVRGAVGARWVQVQARVVPPCTLPPQPSAIVTPDLAVRTHQPRSPAGLSFTGNWELKHCLLEVIVTNLMSILQVQIAECASDNK